MQCRQEAHGPVLGLKVCRLEKHNGPGGGGLASQPKDIPGGLHDLLEPRGGVWPHDVRASGAGTLAEGVDQDSVARARATRAQDGCALPSLPIRCHEIMSLECLKPFKIPKKNTCQCHEGQRKVFLLIESRQQYDSSKTTHDAHLPTTGWKGGSVLISWMSRILTPRLPSRRTPLSAT